MTTAIQAEREDNIRLRKGAEYVAHCRDIESDAIRALADARKQLARAREKYEQIFAECQARAVARRKAGLIACEIGY